MLPRPASSPLHAGLIGISLGLALQLAFRLAPVLHLVALASLLALVVLAVGYRRLHGGTAAALAVVLFVPALLAGSWLVLDQPIALGRAASVDVYGVRGVALVIPPVAALAGGLGFALAGCLLRRGRVWLPRALRGASLAALSLAAALVAGTALHVFQRPAVDRYVTSLPVAAVIPSVDFDLLRIMQRGSTSVGERPFVRDVSVAGFVVRRACSLGRRCSVSLGAAEHPPPRDLGSLAVTVPESASLVLRRDGAGDLVVIEPWSIDGPDIPQVPLAFRGSHLEPTDLFPRDVGHAAAPPRSWFVVAVAGVLFAGLVQRRRRRVRERLARLASAAAGTRDEGGWITFDDPLPPVRLESDDVPAGRVLVLSDVAPRPVTYRSAPPPGAIEVLPGDRDELVAAARSEIVHLDALALAAALLAAAPLVVAAWHRLVF